MVSLSQKHKYNLEMLTDLRVEDKLGSVEQVEVPYRNDPIGLVQCGRILVV